MDLLKILIKYRNQLLFSGIIYSVVIIFIVFFVIKVEYYSNAVIKVREESSLQTMLAGKAFSRNLMDLGIGGISASNADLDYYKGLLLSRSIIYSVMYKFNFKDRYDEDYYFLTAKRIVKNTEITIDEKSELITIGFYDKDSVLACQVVSQFLLELQRKISRIDLFSDSVQLSSINQRFQKTIIDLRKAEENLTNFQLSHRIINPELQYGEAVKALLKIDGELLKLKVLSENIQRLKGSNSNEFINIQNEIDIIMNERGSIQNGKKDISGVSIKTAPKLLMEYYNLFRELKIQSTIFEILLPVYEEAQFKLLNKKPGFIIIDSPFVPEYKARPARALLIILFVVSAFLSHYFILFIVDKYGAIKVKYTDLYEHYITNNLK